MKISLFEQLLSANNAIEISDGIFVFNDYEVYNANTDKTSKYETIADLLSNKEISDIIDKAESFNLRFDGGRGASSGKMSGGFNHARSNGRTETLQNANLNFNTAQGNSLRDVLARFQEKYGDAKVEYGAAVDEQGFVHTLNKGGRTSVVITGNKGETIIHNHPGGGNFSDSDLISVASTQAVGIIATSSNTNVRSTYHFKKNSNFDAKEFVKAVRNAQWPAEYSYDKGADWWLKRNQGKYGYTYSSSSILD